MHDPEYCDVIVIGGGQAGLATGYQLAKRGIRFLILDAHAATGDTWRERWDSLRLFTPSQFDGLEGMRFPARSGSFPTRNEMADYLAAYARRFDLPVRSGMKVEDVSRMGDRFRIVAGGMVFEAGQVVIAMSSYQDPVTPAFHTDLDPRITQFHSAIYSSPAQLRDGPALVVGAGNSGAEIALELSRSRKVWLAGPSVGEVPFRIGSLVGRLAQWPLFRLVFHRLLTTDREKGRKAKAAGLTAPLIRTRSGDLSAAGVQTVARIVGVQDGRPVLEGGTTLDPANVIWCTGYDTDFSWIRLPAFGPDGEPMQVRGVVDSVPGLYFVGLHFLYAFSSMMIHGVSRDASFVADAIARRSKPV